MALKLLLILILTLTQTVLGQWRWTDKVAVVTGASSGIGAEVALQLANKGMIVVALARREHRLQELLQKTNGTIYPKKCDIQKEEEIIEVFQWIKTTLGGVDVLINNAGVLNHSPASTGEYSKWKAIIDTNVMGTTICSREALKTMRTKGDNGQIINVNSLAGHKVFSLRNSSITMYTASKFAITALSEALSNELSDAGSKIKVTNLSPGLVITEMALNQTLTNPEFIDKMKKINPIHPDDVAEAIIYILSTKPGVHIPELMIKQIEMLESC